MILYFLYQIVFILKILKRFGSKVSVSMFPGRTILGFAVAVELGKGSVSN
jgi:hypothetical protein